MDDMLGMCLPISSSLLMGLILTLTLRYSPGRFLVEQMLKMTMAYMLMNYEIEYLPKQISNFVLGPINVPPPSAAIKIRRRATEVE